MKNKLFCYSWLFDYNDILSFIFVLNCIKVYTTQFLNIAYNAGRNHASWESSEVENNSATGVTDLRHFFMMQWVEDSIQTNSSIMILRKVWHEDSLKSINMTGQMDTIKYITDLNYNIIERILIPTAESVDNFSYKIKNLDIIRNMVLKEEIFNWLT